MLLKTRNEAKALNLTRYFTGKPCLRGHIAERLVSNFGCLICAAEKERRSRKKDPELSRERIRKSYILHRNKRLKAAHERYKSDPEKGRAIAQRSRLAHLEKYRQRTRDWRAKNPEKTKVWRETNPEKSRAIVRNRRARKAAADGTHSKEDIGQIRKMQKDRCACCMMPLKRKGHVDHIKPLSKGGSNWPCNLQILCAPCNQTKNSRDPIEFMQSKGCLL